MARISVSNVAAYLNKASFYDEILYFEDFCGLIDRKFKKTKIQKNFDVSNLTIDDTKDTIKVKSPTATKEDVNRIEQQIAIENGIKTEPKYTPKEEEVETQIKYIRQVNEFILIVGIIDYIKDGVLYEIKSRKNKLFKELYESEKIQLQLYMHLTDHYVSVLEENYKNETFRIEEEYDEEYVNNIIKELTDYYITVKEFLKDTKEYYKSKDKKEFIKNLRGF